MTKKQLLLLKRLIDRLWEVEHEVSKDLKQATALINNLLIK